MQGHEVETIWQWIVACYITNYSNKDSRLSIAWNPHGMRMQAASMSPGPGPMLPTLAIWSQLRQTIVASP